MVFNTTFNNILIISWKGNKNMIKYFFCSEKDLFPLLSSFFHQFEIIWERIVKIYVINLYL